jgi:hypothetical protein
MSSEKTSKIEVKSEVTSEAPAKKVKRGKGGGDEYVKGAISDHVNDASERKKKKKESRRRDTLVPSHAVAKILRRLQHWLPILEGIQVKNHVCVLSRAAEKRTRRKAL